MRTLLTLSATLVLVSLALLLNTTTGQTVGNASAATSVTTNNSGQVTLRLPGVGVPTVQISAGGTHTCARTVTGVLCWGNNDYGQLGDGTANSQSTPVMVIGLDSSITAITAGFHHTCALTVSGAVYCWGNNDNGQLGDGTTNNQPTPVAVSGLGNDVVAIAAGYNHTCALTTAGGVKCWGNNENGKLGDGTTINRYTPVNVSELSTGVTAITTGYYHTCALTTAGTVRCWGNNENGELGDGTNTNRLTPVTTQQFNSNVIAITGSSAHNCALTNEGQVQCWGRNSNGQLGDGASTSRWIPVAVAGLKSSVIGITAAGEHACAVLAASTELTNHVQCWGYNAAGQLGNSTTSNQYTPVAVSGSSSSVTTISAGGEHTCALTAMGAVQCWGNNGRGQLGDGTTTNQSTPVTVSGLADSYTTRHDAGDLVRWQTLTYTSPLPTGTPFTLTVRAGNTADTDDDGHWSAWISLGDSPADLTALPPARYLQVRATSTTELLTAFDLGVLTWDSFTYTAKSGILNTNTTWPAANSPYVITGTLVVAQNRTLTLEPGTELWFRDQGRLQVRGGLIALGTPTQPITLTSWHVGKQPGDWRGVVFESTAISSTFNSAGVYVSGSALQQTMAEYAGYGSHYAIDAPTTVLFVDHSTISNHSAGGLRSRGGVVTNNLVANNWMHVTGDVNGVGIANEGNGYIANNTVSNNQAAAEGWNYNVRGVGIYSSAGHVTRNHVEENDAHSVNNAYGSGIYASGGLVTGNTVQENHQTDLYYGHGGGIFAENAEVTDNIVVSNTVHAYYNANGGGIRSTNSLVRGNMVNGNIAYGNEGGGYGGGICHGYGGTVSANQVHGNRAAAANTNTRSVGGGILFADGTGSLSDNDVQDNSAHQGGGVYNSGGTMINNQIVNNHAENNGGGIWWVGDQTMSYNTLTDNTSSGATGGIYIESGYPHLFANRVQDNTGYALYNNNGYVNINTGVNARGNWWGPIDSDAIQTLVFDYNDDPDKGPVDVEEPAGPQMVDLRVSQSAAAIVPAVGHPFTYTVTVYNPSAGNASYVQLQEHLPVTATVQQATSTHGSCTIDNGQALCALGTITGNLTVTVTLVVEPQAPGQLTHRVTVRSTEPDTDESNNQTAHTDLIYVAPRQPLLSGPTIGLYGASHPFTATVQGDGGRAAFIGVDNNTQGNWGGVYGRDGYVLPCWNYNNTLESRPTYIVNSTYSNLNCEGWNWNSSDPRALPGQADNSGQRNAAYGYNSTFFDIILEVNDDTIHDATFYIVDWISAYADIKQRIDLIDPTTGALLATSGMQTGFNNGRYLRFQFRGDVKVRFTPLSGWLAMVSGIFFDTDWTRQFDPTLPLTYTWQAVGQTPVVHVVNDHNPDHMEWLWQQWGRQPITLTASNIAGSVTTYHAIDILTPPSSVTIDGPAQVLIGEPYTYTATVAPITATTPITYIWEFSEGGQAENTGWQASYYTNTHRTGHPAVQRVEKDINFDWGIGSPDPAVPTDNFSARWTRTIYLTSAGVYTFTADCDDWMGVTVDGVTLMNGCDQVTTTLQPGLHTVVVEFVEYGTYAYATFTYSRADGATGRALVQSGGRSTPLQLRWTQPGVQVITVTAVTPLGNAISTYTETVLVPPTQTIIGGPTAGLYGASHLFTATVPVFTGRASFLGVDNSTQGNWGGKYGQDGYVLPYWDYGNTRQSLPAYITDVTYRNFTDGATTWDTNDQRALPAQSDNSGRRSGAFGYNDTSFDITIDVNDNAIHDVAFYMADLINSNMQQRIDLLDLATDTILASSGTQGSFEQGRYVRFRFRGDVKIRFTHITNWVALVNGIFFDTDWAIQHDPTLPLTYTWQAAGQTPVIHVVNDHNPARVEWLWNQWGRQPITLTVRNIAGSAATYHAVDILTPPSSVTINGPAQTLIGEQYIYTATVAPITATTPITYIWEFSEGGQAENAGWQASYYTNTHRAGHPAVQRVESDLNFDWSGGSPDPAVPVDNFSARWTRTIYLANTGVYTFTTQCDDWMSVAVDGVTLRDGCGSITTTLQPGIHTIVVEFVENYGSASAHFTWERADGTTDPGRRAIVQPNGRNTPLQLRWAQPGSQIITVTAVTPLGNAVSTYTETVLVPPSQATIGGPTVGLYGASHPFTATVRGNSGRTTFIGVDNDTQGNWGGQYGHDGYVLPCWDYGNTLENRPAYIANITYNNMNCSGWDWNSIGDQRALPAQADNGGRRSAALGYNNSFELMLDVSDNEPHDVAIYIVDWSNANIQQRIDLLNPATDAILATSGIQRDFFINGRYLRFQFRGDIKVRFTRLGDSHAVVSGIFFDTGLTPLPDPTLPLTYTWQAVGQTPVVHVVNDNNPDQVEWLWRQWGRQPLTLTVSNIAGRDTTYHAIDIITPPAGVSIRGPGEILLAQPTAFTATVTPLTTTAPITYLWEFSPGGSLGDGLWQASYWNNTDRSGEPALRRTEAAIDFDWGWNSSPAPGINTDSFSARWSRQIYVATPGTYRFTTQCDDWMRVQVDAAVISDGCQNVEQYLATGLHTLTVEFIEYGGYARASFTYVRADGAPDFMNGSRVVQVGGLTNVITPTWALSGTHTITVTAFNRLDAVSSTHTILVRQPQTLLGAVRDGGDLVTWQHLPWSETLPADTPYTVYARVGNSATPDTHWSDWVALGTPDAGNLTTLPPARYLQWQVKGAGTVDLAPHFQVGTPTAIPFAYTRAPQRITANTTWTRANSPYLVTSQVLIGVGVRLTIEPGVTVRFSGPHVFLVEGTLVARGTITQPITFTSWHVQGRPGDWGFLVFEETAQDATFDNNQNYLSGSALQHVVVEYGGGRVVTAAKPATPSYDYATLGYAVDAVNTSLYVDHARIRHNQAGGLRSKGGVITNNTIVSNTLSATRDIDGLGIATVGSGLLAYNLITNNQITATNRNYTVRGIGLYAAAGSQVISNVIAYNSADNMNLLYGGGLYAGHGATVTDNQVRANTGTQINTIYGGGIYVEADSTVQHNTVQANRASAGTVYGGGLALGDGSRASNNGVQDNQVRAEGDSRGGGIYSRNATLQANVVIGNRQETTNYGQSYGGGIYSEAYDWWDAVQNRYRTGESLLVDNTVTDNQSSGRSAFGGAIYASGRFSITNNLLRANQVAYPNADDSNQAAYGGGIYAVGGQNGESCGAIVGSLHNNEIVSNQALGQRGYAGGAYLVNTTVQNSLIVNNSAGGNYGALWWKCDGAVTHTRIANNTSAGSTGGLYIEGRPVLNHNAIIDNSGYALNTISQNNNPRLNARYNWWGTTDEENLDNLIYDFFDNPQRGFVNYIPYLQAAPTLSPTGGTVTGRTAGLVGSAYRFDVSVYPVAALKPVQFQWQTETGILSHTVNALTDYAALSWTMPGSKTITITATNAEGSTVITHTVAIAAVGNSDAYETDDTCAQAQSITTTGTPQVHTIHTTSDVDWVTFPATAGATYVIEATSPEDSHANMKLEVYSACAGNSVSGQDNSFGPDTSVTLNAPASGPLYLRLIDESGAVNRGLAATYNLSVRALTQTPEPGLVILVAGKLKPTDAVQPNIYKVIEDAYAAFSANGHPADRIYYLAPDLTRDVDHDGVKDVDALSARGSLQTAITEWARAQLQPGQSLTLYLMDHGDQDVFYLNLLNNRLETVEPRELNEWLAEVEAAVPGVKINIIIEACRSGSFITASDLVQTISKPGRVVIASTGALPLAYASPNGGAMFSDVFIAALRRGLSLNSSFAEARWAVQESHPAQTPWLDDNGNGIPNESQDGQLAATRGFAYAGTFANVEWPPYIDAASFAADSGQIQTQVEAQGSGTVQRVWARIYPPSYVPPAEGEELVIETLPEVELYRQAGSNVYQGNYPFGETGAYRVVIYATDSRDLLARPVDASDAIEAEPTATPTATPTPTATATTEATATNTATPTATPTATVTPSPTPSPTPSATGSTEATPTPTMTESVAASPTPTVSTPEGATTTPTLTPTDTGTPTPTETATPTATGTVASTITSTETPTPTATDTVTPTATSTETPTPTNTATPTEIPTPTTTSSATLTPMPTATEAATVTPIRTATGTPTATPLATATASPTATPTTTAQSTVTPTSTSTATPTPTSTSVATATVTATPTGVVIIPTVESTVVADLETLQTTLTFPPGAVAQPVVVVVAPAVTPPATGGFQVLGQVFTIDATADDGSPVTHFNQPFTLVVTYTDAEVLGIDEQTLTLHYWHEGQQTWIAIPTTVDAVNNRLTATLDHLTTFAVLQGQVSNPARIFLPLVQR